jgi:PAS domain S-box-containing protein
MACPGLDPEHATRSESAAWTGEKRSPKNLAMTLDELVRAFSEHLSIGVVVTDPLLDAPGPILRYVNPAFCRITGYSAEELVGGSPRRLQGEATQRLTLRAFSRALRGGRRFHGVVVNYRKSGERYLCEIDARPLYGDGGSVARFIAFQREVVKPRGRPRENGLRYRPVLPEEAIVHPAIAGLSPFAG